MLKDFLSIHDLSIYEFHELLDLARRIKENPRQFQKKLQNKTLALVSQKPSFTTKATFEVGMLQLGGHTVYLEAENIHHDQTPSPFELAKNLERLVDGIILETVSHEFLLEFTRISRVPVINASTPYIHPCQALADFFTIKEHHKDPANIKFAYFGPGNMICHSLILAAAKAGTEIIVAAPPGNEPGQDILKLAKSDGKDTSFRFKFTSNPEEAALNADIVYSDQWVFPPPGDARKKQKKTWKPYQINEDILSKAKTDALLMYGHPCLPQNEAAEEFCHSKQSVVFDQIENKLHIQKAIMLLLIEIKK